MEPVPGSDELKENTLGSISWGAMAFSRLAVWSIAAATFVFPLNCSGAQTGSQTQERLATGGLISSLLATPVVGEPYSAVQVHGRVQTLADGSTVSHHGHHFVARDGEGRVHVEVRMAEGQNGEPDTVMVFVMDPVAHTVTTWLSGAPNHPPNDSKVATVFKIPSAENRPATSPARPTPSESARPQPIVTTEDLGTKQIQGLEVVGKRTTTIVPVGRSGNSAPITKTYEIWTSADLQLVVKQEWNDPRSGKRTVALEKLSRTAPDPALFRVPPGYVVKDAVQTLQELEQKLEGLSN
jgi:hypothetical protein